MSVREQMFHRHGCVVCHLPKSECPKYQEELAGMLMIVRGMDKEQALRVIKAAYGNKLRTGK